MRETNYLKGEIIMKMSYHQNGDYLIPNITMKGMTEDIGKYGMMRKNYLKEQRGILYTIMLLQEKLYPHLLEIDKTANKRLEQMIEEMTKQSPPPDKETNQMAWVAHMNSLKAAAEEVIFKELIYI